MTEIIVIVLPPVSLFGIFYLFKYCVDKITHYNELKLLIESGVEQAVVENDHVSFQK